jgi:dUTP pyrophosphatase
MKSIKVKILDKEFFTQYPLPTYATNESAGLDLRACIEKSTTVIPGTRFLCPTGLAVDLNDKNMAMFLIPKSGLGHKKGVILGNSVGLLDSDYHQQVYVSVWNTGVTEFIIEPGDFVAQAYFAPVIQVQWEIVEDFNRSVERTGGFGSTGTR